MRPHCFMIAPQRLTGTSVINFLSMAPDHGNTRDPKRQKNDTKNDKVGFTKDRLEGPAAAVSISTSTTCTICRIERESP